MNAVDHNNVVIFDDRGIPSIMCRFARPKDTEEIPAVFKIGDKVADAIYISKYPNTVIDGRAYSMPMADPTVNITFDEAVQACRCKGFIGFGARYSEEVPVKTSPAWCPKKAEGSNE